MRVLIGSDHPLIREGLSVVLNKTPDLKIVASASDWHSLLAAAIETRPDLVLLDVERAGFGWVRAAEQIQKLEPRIVLACISASGDLDFLEAMSAAGAVVKSIINRAGEETLDFIRLLTGEQDSQVLSSSIAPLSSLKELTPRERDVLRRVAQGSMNQEIAGELGLSIRTVEFHRANILRKTGARSAADLTRYAIQSGALPTKAQ